MLKELPKVGDKVRYLGGEENYSAHGLFIGEVYEVTGDSSNSDGAEVTIDVGDDRWYIFGNRHESGSDLHKYELVEEVAEDAVNSPSHYKRGKFETIEVIEHITAGYDDPFTAYCIGNAAKYIDRAPFKHDSPTECLRKAAWYLMRAADHAEASE